MQWLGFRYAEKCDFEASKGYFKRVRDYTAPHLNVNETLELYRRSKPKMTPEKLKRGVSNADTENEENEEVKEIKAAIRLNVCKGGWVDVFLSRCMLYVVFLT